jgi:hypothetical protein
MDLLENFNIEEPVKDSIDDIKKKIDDKRPIRKYPNEQRLKNLEMGREKRRLNIINKKSNIKEEPVIKQGPVIKETPKETPKETLVSRTPKIKNDKNIIISEISELKNIIIQQQSFLEQMKTQPQQQQPQIQPEKKPKKPKKVKEAIRTLDITITDNEINNIIKPDIIKPDIKENSSDEKLKIFLDIFNKKK